MTDTLRQECEAWVDVLPWVIHRTPEEYSQRVDWLMAFARAQQAKGLREAAREAHRRVATGDIFNIYAEYELPRLAAWCEVQATAREKGEA